MEIMEFFVDLILLAVLWPWDDSWMSPGGKGGRSLGLRTMPTSCANCLEILGAALRVCPGMYGDSFTFTLPSENNDDDDDDDKYDEKIPK